LIKVFGFIFFFIWIRATFPRFRYDQLMKFGWKVLFPLALANILLTAVGLILFSK
jgi:NADH-quinone oxidoreductase subunit H